MGWFEYGYPEKKALRRGVCLRIRSLPGDLRELANKGMRDGEVLDYIQVHRIRKNNRVLLKFVAHHPQDKLNNYLDPIEERSTVFYVDVDENPEWICESDVGRGYKE